MKLHVQNEYRALAEFQPGAIDEKTRTVTLTGSSEIEVERFDWETGERYLEVLSHDPADVDLSRMLAGGPVLDRHRGDQIGIVDGAEVRDGKTHFACRFSSSTDRARVIFDDVCAGIRRNVSVGYQKTGVVSQERTAEGIQRIVFRWQPYEISFEPVPADPTVGVGRELATGKSILDLPEDRAAEIITNNKGDEAMSEVTTTTEPVAVKDTGITSERMSNLYSLAAQSGAVEDVRKMLGEGKSEAEILDSLLRRQMTAKPVSATDAEIGMDKKQVRAYSLRKALLAQLTGDWREAGLEKEASDAVAKTMNRDARGFFIPLDVMNSPVAQTRREAEAAALLQRDLIVGSSGTGKNWVATDLLAGDFIALLRNATFLDKVGAFFLSGLRDNIAIPRVTGGNAYYWVAEQSNLTKSTQAYDQVTLTPKQLGAMTIYSRLFLQQASLGVESFVRAELAITLAQGIDWGCLYGAGVGSYQPLGLFNRPGVNTVAIDTNGGAITAATLVDMETAVADCNVIENDTMAYVTNARVRGALKKTPILSNTAAIPIWQPLAGIPGAGEVNGYPCYVTNTVAKNGTKGSGRNLSSIIYGKWSDFVVGFWGGLDIVVDPFTGAAAGDTRVVAFQSIDTATRHDESFAICTDIVAGGASDDSSSSSSSSNL